MMSMMMMTMKVLMLQRQLFVVHHLVNFVVVAVVDVADGVAAAVDVDVAVVDSIVDDVINVYHLTILLKYDVLVIDLYLGD